MKNAIWDEHYYIEEDKEGSWCLDNYPLPIYLRLDNGFFILYAQYDRWKEEIVTFTAGDVKEAKKTAGKELIIWLKILIAKTQNISDVE